MAYVDIGCRCALAIVFVVSAYTKLNGRPAFAAFVRSVRRLGVLPSPGAARLAGIAVAAAEVTVPLLMLVGWPPAVAAGYGVAALMLAAFTVGIAASLRRGDRTPCGCFGRSTVPLGGRHIVRNLLLLAIAATGLIAVLTRDGDLEFGVAAVAAAAGLVLGGLVTLAEDITELILPTTRHRTKGQS